MSFQVYPKYSESGIEWLKKIPEHWKIISLSHSLDSIFSGITADQIDASETTIPVTRIETISQGVINWEKVGYIESAFKRDDRKLASGDICFSNINSLDMIGNVAIYDEDKDLYAGINLLVLRASKSNFSKYLYWLLRSKSFRKVIESLAKPAINQASISQGSLLSVRIPIPPLSEQIDIASFIDKETKKIDDLINQQEKLVKLLKIKLDALVLSSFDLSDTKILRLKHITDVIERPVEQQVGVMYEPLGLLNRGRGLFHKERREKADMGDSDFYWVKEGDLIISGQFAWEGAVALAYGEEEDCVVSHRYHLIRGKQGVVLTEYLYALLTTAHGDFLLNDSSIGAAGRNRPLNINLLLKEKIYVPNFEIQQTIAKIVTQRKDLLFEIEKQRSLLNERRSTLITAAVTGQIDVRNNKSKEAA